MNKILAIDFSTKDTGYAFRNPLTNEIVVGAIKGGKDKDPLERTKLIAEGIGELIEYYNLHDYFIAIEEPIITMKTKGNISLVRANGYFLALMFSKFNIGSVDCPNSKWASFHLIKGKRAERKEQSQAILRSYKIVPDEVVNDDMADAFCILLYMESQGE
jgi:Holliday junction resolvasome RuvABC endonuclease subunit